MFSRRHPASDDAVGRSPNGIEKLGNGFEPWQSEPNRAQRGEVVCLWFNSVVAHV
jgi:hypothetical protein